MATTGKVVVSWNEKQSNVNVNFFFFPHDGPFSG
jgi:hypothetical protein